MLSLQAKPLASDEKSEYTNLVQEDTELSSLNELQDGYPRRGPPSTLRRSLLFTGKALLLIVSTWGLVSIFHLANIKMREIHQPSERFAPSTYPSCSCGGTTVARALELGCVFTPLAIAWLPPHCVDQELSDDFDRQGPGPNGQWDYWIDVNKTRRLSRQEVGELADIDGVFYATQEWHVSHCVYTWQKHYRSQWTGTVIERRSNGLDHIGHCESVFRIRSGLQDIRTVAGIALDADDPGET